MWKIPKVPIFLGCFFVFSTFHLQESQNVLFGFFTFHLQWFENAFFGFCEGAI